MKKLTILFTMVFAMMVSCSENAPFKKATTITPVSESINGSLGDYYSIVNRNYKIMDGVVRIDFKRVQDGFPAPWKKNVPLGYSDGCYEPSFTVEFLDETGNVVSKATTDIVSQKEELQFLAANKVDESSTLTFRIEGKDVKKFRVSSLFEVHKPEQQQVISFTNSVDSVMASEFNDMDTVVMDLMESVQDVVDETVEMIEEQTEAILERIEEDIPTNVSKNWDKLLDEYEQYVDNYIKFMKKAKSGDISAIAEYATMLEKTERLSDELEKEQGEMTSAQLKRYTKISQKLTNAALEMY